MPSGEALVLATLKFLGGRAHTAERTVIALIVAFAVFRGILAATLGLGVDESYGISVSRELNLSYFDHPPLHYWITHFFMPLVGDGRTARLPYILLFMATTWSLYLLTRQLFGPVAGVWAVLALNLSTFFTLAGCWALPDGPLMLSLVAAAYTISRAFFPDGEAPSPWSTWAMAGIWIGLAALSKYHAILFAGGLFIYLVSVPARRTVLRHPALWVGAAIALLVASPVLIWNAEHGWASIFFQARRGSPADFPRIGQFLANIGGQLLWLAPWLFVPMVIAAYQALRQGRTADRSWFCLCLGIPTIALFTFVPLWGDRGLPHWQMPGWLMLFPILGKYIADEAAVRSRPWIWARASAATLFIFAFLAVGHAATGYGRVLIPALFAQRDPTLESLEWEPLRTELLARNLLDKKDLFIISHSWIDVGKIDFALNGTMPIQVFGKGKQYAFRYKPGAFLGHDALIIGRSDRLEGIEAGLSSYFDSIEELPPFMFGRSGMREVTVRILYAKHLRKPLPQSYGKPDN